jgi:hypothetical protein
MKRCPRCGETKSETEFHRNHARHDGLAGYCKNCWASLETERRNRRAAQKSETGKAWYVANREKRAAKGRAWKNQNRQRSRALNAEAQNRRMAADPLYRAHRRLVSRINTALRAGWPGHNLASLLGYSLADLRHHLEAAFTPGMTWANRGTVWEIDHVRGVAEFTLYSGTLPDLVTAALRECWSLENLRPLPWQQNRRRNRRD